MDIIMYARTLRIIIITVIIIIIIRHTARGSDWATAVL